MARVAGALAVALFALTFLPPMRPHSPPGEITLCDCVHPLSFEQSPLWRFSSYGPFPGWTTATAILVTVNMVSVAGVMIGTEPTQHRRRLIATAASSVAVLLLLLAADGYFLATWGAVPLSAAGKAELWLSGVQLLLILGLAVAPHFSRSRRQEGDAGVQVA